MAVEPVVSVWDVAPIELLVAEAGGRCTNIHGAPLRDGRGALSTNGVLHDACTRVLGPAPV